MVTRNNLVVSRKPLSCWFLLRCLLSSTAAAVWNDPFDLPIIAVAKGPDRNAGRERIFQPERPALLLGPRDPLLYLIQRLRDEAHSFAISAHRLGRKKSRLTSALDQVPGIGAKRKRTLLLHFGSATAVARAGMADLEAVEGISKSVAKKIYDHFNA